MLTVVRLPTQGVPQFLEQAVRFANEDLWGTLSCTLVLHPDTEKHFPAETEKVGLGAAGNRVLAHFRIASRASTPGPELPVQAGSLAYRNALV